MHKALKLILSLTFTLSGLGLFGNGLYMGGKAIVAQVLLERAWSKTAQTGDIHLPWTWMDAYPVAKLTLEGDKRTHIILNTDSGQALAFGPAIIKATKNKDLLAIAAHKNTQFQKLATLTKGKIITLERPKGEILTYKVTHTQILDSRTEGLPIEASANIPTHLALVTCYPFNSVSFNGPLRYVVYAERVLSS